MVAGEATLGNTMVADARYLRLLSGEAGPSGCIVVGGGGDDRPDGVVLRYGRGGALDAAADGSPVPSFDGDRYAVTGSDRTARAVALQDDARLLLAGTYFTPPRSGSFRDGGAAALAVRIPSEPGQ